MKPIPAPSMVKAMIRYHAGVPVLMNTSMTLATEIAAPPMTRDGRVPRRPTSRPDTGELRASTAAMGRMSAPVMSAE